MTASDITSTLSDLERKLEELERDLATAGTSPDPVGAPPAARPGAPMAVRPGSSTAARPAPLMLPPDAPAPASLPPAPAASVPPVPSRPVPGAPAPASPAALPAAPALELAELERFRERIEESARRLAAEYAELVARTTAAVAGTAPAAWAPPSSPPLPAHGAPAATIPPPVGPDAMEVRAPVEVPAGAEYALPAPPAADPVVEGAVRIDAGPFSDITTLSQFEQALARIPGAQDVYVTGFEGDRAQIDLEVTGPVALASALAEVSPVPVTVHAPPPGGTVRLDIDGAPAHGA